MKAFWSCKYSPMKSHQIDLIRIIFYQQISSTNKTICKQAYTTVRVAAEQLCLQLTARVFHILK